MLTARTLTARCIFVGLALPATSMIHAAYLDFIGMCINSSKPTASCSSPHTPSPPRPGPTRPGALKSNFLAGNGALSLKDASSQTPMPTRHETHGGLQKRDAQSDL